MERNQFCLCTSICVLVAVATACGLQNASPITAPDITPIPTVDLSGTVSAQSTQIAKLIQNANATPAATTDIPATQIPTPTIQEGASSISTATAAQLSPEVTAKSSTHRGLAVGDKLTYDLSLLMQSPKQTIKDFMIQKIVSEDVIGSAKAWVIDTETPQLPQQTQRQWVDQATGITIKASSITRNMPYALGGVITVTSESTFDLNSKTGIVKVAGSDSEGSIINAPTPMITSSYSAFLVTGDTKIGMYYPWSDYTTGLQVVSSEQIAVRAGKFDCWVLKNVSDENSAPAYFDKQTGLMVKMVLYAFEGNMRVESGSVELASFERSSDK